MNLLADAALPFITAMLVMRNEQSFIQKALGSLLEQDYPEDRYEILVIDGMSDDASVHVAKEAIKEFRRVHNRVGPDVRFFENPGRLLAIGWNLGIREAKGGYVVRIDAHATAERNFIASAVRVMGEQPQSSCVGGVLTSLPSSKEGELVAHALSSPFGVGNSRFRISGRAGAVDTVAFGLYKKEIFEQVGYFNESLKRNQDNEMHGRIRDAGGIFWFDPSIKSTYYTRSTVKGMVKQATGNGKWNAVLLKSKPQSLSVRHLVPAVFVLSLLILALLGIFRPVFLYLLVVELALYLACALFFASRKVSSIGQIMKLCGLFFLLHFSYGLGTLGGLFSKSPWKDR